MKNTLKAAGVFAALGLLTTLSPSQARAEKTLGEQCHDRGGMWVGDPINSQSTGSCLLKLTVGGGVDSERKCKTFGGIPTSGRCRMKAEVFSKFVRQSPR
jgi:hypothetical protein